MLGALEAGGTKMVMAVGDGRLAIVRSAICATRLPDETVQDILAFFRVEKIDALGIASFGPVNLDRHSPQYGAITNTPKLAWRNYPLLQTLRDALGVPCAMDTDVNAAVWAEAQQGAAQGLKNALYFTVGTGIGGGLLSEGRLVHGMIHPEWGHVIVSRHEEDPLTRGICPYHANCVEGFASGPSMQARWGMPASELPDGHRGWEMQAYYLAQLCVNAMMAVSPERILLGGGVMHRESLLPLVRKQVTALLGGYLSHARLEDMDSYLCPPALYPDSGIKGALLLAQKAAAGEEKTAKAAK